MHYCVFFLFAVLVVSVESDCSDYVECFSDFLRDFFGDITDDKDAKLFKDGDIDVVVSNVSNIIKKLETNDNVQTYTKNHVNDKTKIFVKAFQIKSQSFEDDEKLSLTETRTKDSLTTMQETSESTEGTTDFVSTTDAIVRNDTPFQLSTTDRAKLIPLSKDSENEIITNDIIVDSYYDIGEDNATDYPNIDYVELYKDTTNEYVTYFTTTVPSNILDYSHTNQVNAEESREDIIKDDAEKFKISNGLKNVIARDISDTVETCSGLKASVSKAVFPWIATIYLRNDSKQGQFDYYCDGAIISESAVLTAARCVHEGNRAISASEFIVFAGKTSHKSLGDKEKVLRIKAIKTHENFTIQDGVAKNDLAILILEETLKFDDVMSQACLETEEGLSNNATKSVTTAWNLFGDLTLIYFDKEKSQACDSDNKVENTFCATYSDDVPLCPSYGGVYVSRSSNKLYLSGIRTGDPQRSGVCFGKDIDYTSLRSYSGWIKDNAFPNKDI